MKNRLNLRLVEPEDRDFLYQVYASTREEELAPLGWERAATDEFLWMQFTAQDKFYTEQFPQAQFRVIQLDEQPIGRLYTDLRPDEIRVIDIALLPDFRGKGLGTALLEDILAQGQALGLPIRIHVEQFNPALSLYERIGFRQVEEQPPYYLLEWSPSSGVGGLA